VADLSADDMARMMVGAEPPRASASRTERAPGPMVLEVAGLSADDDLGTPALADLRLEVRAGEIVGIAGVSGNGQEELVEVLAGQRAARAGSINVSKARYAARRAEMRRLGVRCLPEQPLRNACVPSMSVAENLGFRRFDQPPFAVARALVSGRALRRAARELIAAFRVKTPSPDAAIASLSGGNVQRAVLARELGEDIALLVAANPCFGLDFAAVAEIRMRLVEARNRGAAVLLISADLDEIFALSDRILVMFEGRIVHQTDVASADVAEIGRHMAGHHT
jgi:simple sugar transport system ATP-binding protein